MPALITVLPEPPTARLNPVPVIAPVLLSVSVPESELILEAAVSVTRPPHVLSPEIFRSEPFTAASLRPARDRDSLPTAIPSCNCKAPPVTTVPADVPPKASALGIFRTPPVTVVVPE